MAYIDELYQKQERIYRDCCEINDCSKCYHCNGNTYRDCDLILISREIDKELQVMKER